jgi:polyisoprenoid-binding protein YceI
MHACFGRTLRPLLAATALAWLAGPPAARADETYKVDPAASTLTYHLVHKLHRFDGTSKLVEGRARLVDDGRAQGQVPVEVPIQVIVRAPIDSFDSGDSNRDAHMKEAIEAARYPVVELKAAGAVARDAAPAEHTLTALVTFHGVQKQVQVPVSIVFESPSRVHARSRFSISLEEFRVERPSLMFVKVDDALVVDADLFFTR